MSLISPAQISDGTTIDAADVNNPINTIANDYNGNIDNSNIKSAAAIDGAKVATNTVNTDTKHISIPTKFSVYKTTTQSAVATTTKITWDTELFDTGSNFATSTFTAPSAGFYWFKASLYVSSSTTFAYVSLYKNGVLYTPGDAQSSSASGDIVLSVTELLQLTTSDTVDVRVAFSGGGTRDILGVTGVAIGTTGFSKFEGMLVSAT